PRSGAVGRLQSDTGDEMSSYVIAAPEALAAASADLGGIGSAITEANAAAAAWTTEVLAAGQDEGSGANAELVGGYAQEYQAVSARVAVLHDQFTQALGAGAGAYAATEVANASPLAGLADLDPVKLLTGRPLFGDGANGQAHTGENGGDGGWLFGN